MADRFDFTKATKWKLDHDNNLIVDSTPTRTGIFIYHGNNGEVIKELRHPEDVFKADSLATLENVPYTVQENHVSLFTPKDTTGKAYGVTFGKVDRSDDNVAAKLKIWDEGEINKVLDRESLELSCGYKCDYYTDENGSPIGGTHDGEKYDMRQKNIRYNHVARVKKARGGETCRIHLDSDSAISGIGAERIDSGENQKQSNGENMADKIKVIQFQLPALASGEKFKLDAQDIEFDESQSASVEKFKAREQILFGQVQKLDSELVANSVEISRLKGENKTLIETNESSIPKAKLDAEVEKLTAINELCKSTGVKDYEKMTPEAKTKAVIEASGIFEDAKLDSAEWCEFAISHLRTDHAQKVIKSRKNLELHKGTKFDEGDAGGESELEQA